MAPDACAVESALRLDGQALRGEHLVHLDHVHV
jgi:hypothetical protein